MNNKLIIGFGIIFLVIMVFMCVMLYQLNNTLNNMSAKIDSMSDVMSEMKSYQDQMAAALRAIRVKYVGTGFSATPFN